MAILTSISSGSSVSQSHAQRARSAMVATNPSAKVNHLAGKGVLMHAATQTTSALIDTKKAEQANELKVHAMRGENVVARMEAIGQEKLALIAEQQKNISLGKALDPALADRFDALTTQQQRLCLEYKLGDKRVLADPAVAPDAGNLKFSVMIAGSYKTIEMPTVDMSLMYVNTKAVRQAFDDTKFFDASMVQDAKDAAAAAGAGDAAQITAALGEVRTAINNDYDVQITIGNILPTLWTGKVHNLHAAGSNRFVVNTRNIDTIDELAAFIGQEINSAVSDFERAKYTETLGLVRESADIDAASTAAHNCLKAAHQSFEALRETASPNVENVNVDAAATYANLEPMIEFVQQNVTIIKVNGADASVHNIDPDTPIWTQGAAAEDAGAFDGLYLSQDMINRVLGFTLPTIDGVDALVDDTGANVGNVCSIRTAEQMKIALQAEPQVIRYLATVREKMANIVSDLGGAEMRRHEVSAARNDCVAEISALDPTTLQEEVNLAQQREFSAAYAIHGVYANHNDLLVSLNS